MEGVHLRRPIGYLNANGFKGQFFGFTGHFLSAQQTRGFLSWLGGDPSTIASRWVGHMEFTVASTEQQQPHAVGSACSQPTVGGGGRREC